MSKNRAHFSFLYDVNDIFVRFDFIQILVSNPCFHFYFFNTDILLNIDVTELEFGTQVKNITIKGSMSQIFYLGLSFYFIKKKLVTFGVFF